MTISAIVARSSNGVIGKNNQLPWHLPADLKYFKQLTLGHAIIMGRKTYESIGKPLPGRLNIVVTRNEQYRAEGCRVINSLENALQEAAQSGGSECFIIGGAELFQQSLSRLGKLYLTEVKADVEGDVFWQDTGNNWQEISRQSHPKDEKHQYEFDFVVFEKNQGK